MAKSSDEATIEELKQVWDICSKFITDRNIVCEEASVKDGVYAAAPLLVCDLGNIIGWYDYEE